MILRLLRRAFALAFLALAVQATAQDATLDRARQMIDAQDFQGAFALLDPLEAERAGDPDYDFLLGLAAIDAGRLTRAVFALERVLASRPDDPRVRAEIGRAYFLMGEAENAKREFAAVKAAKPPAPVVANVDRFLDALDIRGNRPPTDREGFTGFAETGFGHDTNANSATSTGSFPIPLFPGAIFNLGAGSTAQPDNYATFGAGINGRKFLSADYTLFGSAGLDKRLNQKLNGFDTLSLSATAGISWEKNADEISLAGQVQTFEVNYARFRNAVGGVLQWRRNFSAFDQFTGYAQYSKLDYPGQPNRDADRTALGGAWSHAFDTPSNPLVYLSGYFGEEDQKNVGFPHFGHRFAGFRFGGQVTVGPELRLAGSFSHESRRQNGQDPLFLATRRDRENNLSLSLPWDFERNWTLTPQVNFTDSKSNIVVSDYGRTQFFVTLRHAFR